jgi:hypothetical protein
MGRSYAYVGSALGGFPDHLVRLPSFSLALFIIFDHFGKLIHSPPLLHLVVLLFHLLTFPLLSVSALLQLLSKHLANWFEIE